MEGHYVRMHQSVMPPTPVEENIDLSINDSEPNSSHHSDDQLPGSGFACDACVGKFNSQQELDAHQQQKHPKNNSRIASAVKTVQDSRAQMNIGAISIIPIPKRQNPPIANQPPPKPLIKIVPKVAATQARPGLTMVRIGNSSASKPIPLALYNGKMKLPPTSALASVNQLKSVQVMVRQVNPINKVHVKRNAPNSQEIASNGDVEIVELGSPPKRNKSSNIEEICLTGSDEGSKAVVETSLGGEKTVSSTEEESNKNENETIDQSKANEECSNFEKEPILDQALALTPESSIGVSTEQMDTEEILTKTISDLDDKESGDSKLETEQEPSSTAAATVTSPPNQGNNSSLKENEVESSNEPSEVEEGATKENESSVEEVENSASNPEAVTSEGNVASVEDENEQNGSVDEAKEVSEDEALPCSKCWMSFDSKFDLEEHEVNKHPKSDS